MVFTFQSSPTSSFFRLGAIAVVVAVVAVVVVAVVATVTVVVVQVLVANVSGSLIRFLHQHFLLLFVT